MKRAPLLFVVLLVLALSDSVALVADPWDNPYGSSGSPSQRWNAYPDGSSRPLNPGPGGRRNDDEYNSRQQEEQQWRQHQRQSQPSYELPAAPVTKDFNVWKDGNPTLCTQTKQDVYCY